MDDASAGSRTNVFPIKVEVAQTAVFAIAYQQKRLVIADIGA